MKIWVDADACPVVIKEILFKAAERTGVELTLVANQAVRIPSVRCIHFIRVASGLDVADNEIVKRLGVGDLVVTADIPLAANVIEKGGRYDEYDLYGERGGYVRIMDKNAAGHPCPNCGSTVEKIQYLGGACYLCPTCQV